MKIGHFNTLEILRETSVGLFLGDEENDVLLPNKYVPASYEIGDMITVFIYRDSEDRIIATDIVPKIQMNEFAALEVRQVNQVGAFLDWGLEKDLIVPFNQQHRKMEEGEWHVVYLYHDEVSDRVAGTAKLGEYLSSETENLSEKQQVSLLVFKRTPLGYKCVIDQKYEGMLYHNEIYEDLVVGDQVTGYIKTIRPDGKVDISLQKQGYERIEGTAGLIYDLLQRDGGYIPLHDKSEPEEIKGLLNMSKKVFKKSIGTLYRQKLITIEPDGIRLV